MIKSGFIELDYEEVMGISGGAMPGYNLGMNLYNSIYNNYPGYSWPPGGTLQPSASTDYYPIAVLSVRYDGFDAARYAIAESINDWYGKTVINTSNYTSNSDGIMPYVPAFTPYR